SDHVLGVSDEVFDFLRDVLTQVADLFPAPYVHIGGDECPRVEWERSPAARARMNEWGLTRVSEIQGRFTQFAADVLAEKGKRIIACDEVLESHLPDDTVIMNWRHGNGLKESTSRGFRTIIANNEHAYFDHYQASPKDEPLAIGGLTTVKDVYTATFSPHALDEEQQKLLMGLQGQVWTEYMPSAAQVQYMAFPRMCALAERAWGSPEQSWEEFEERLRAHLPRLDAFGIRYRPLDRDELLPPRRPPVRPLRGRRAPTGSTAASHAAPARDPAGDLLDPGRRAGGDRGVRGGRAARARGGSRGHRGEVLRPRADRPDLPGPRSRPARTRRGHGDRAERHEPQRTGGRRHRTPRRTGPRRRDPREHPPGRRPRHDRPRSRGIPRGTVRGSTAPGGAAPARRGAGGDGGDDADRRRVRRAAGRDRRRGRARGAGGDARGLLTAAPALPLVPRSTSISPPTRGGRIPCAGRSRARSLPRRGAGAPGCRRGPRCRRPRASGR